MKEQYTEILTKLNNLETLVPKNFQSEVSFKITTVTVIVFFVLGCFFIWAEYYRHKRNNTTGYLKKRKMMVGAIGFAYSFVLTGVSMIYYAVIFENANLNTNYFSNYILVGTTAIGLGLSAGTFLSSTLDSEISAKLLKDFMRKLSIDDISKISKLNKRIRGVHDNSMKNPSNTKTELTKISQELEEIIKKNKGVS